VSLVEFAAALVVAAFLYGLVVVLAAVAYINRTPGPYSDTPVSGGGEKR
jgi:hypothetical protein